MSDTLDNPELRSLYAQYLYRHGRKQNRGRAFTRDSEKRKTYSAEWAFQSVTTLREFENIEEARKYAKKITRSATWKKLLGQRQTVQDMTVRTKQKNGRGYSGWAQGNTIVLDSKIGMNEYVLIHELTHCLGNWHHGRSFRRDLLKLVSRFIGTYAAKTLKAEFKKRKLQFGEERKPLSFDKWLAARQRALNAQNNFI